MERGTGIPPGRALGRRRGGTALFASLLVLASLFLWAVSAASPAAGSHGDPWHTTGVVSLSITGGTASAPSDTPAVSADGRYVAFASQASNLVAGDTNGVNDIFVRDRGTQTTVRVSVSSAGTEGNEASGPSPSGFPAISADGRFVAFESFASNLVPDDDNEWWDLFLHDRDADGDGIFDEPGAIATTRPVPVSDSDHHNPALSADGQFLAFDSTSSMLVDGDTNNANDVFVYNRLTGTTVRVSVNSAGEQATGLYRDSLMPRLSADGRFVAFESWASLVAGDTNSVQDIYVHDRDADADGVFDEPGAIATVRVSVSSAGAQGVGRSRYPSISADGRFVAFESNANNLVGDDLSAIYNVFVHDRDADGDGIFDEPGAIATTRVSVPSAGGQGNNHSGFASLSANGRFVAFDSIASNLVPNDTNEASDGFVHDRLTGETVRATVSSAGDQGALSYNSSATVLSANGLVLAFISNNADFVPGHTTVIYANGDIFIATREAIAEPTPTPVPPTATPVPPTATPIPPTATPIPPTATPVPPTPTPVPNAPPVVDAEASRAPLYTYRTWTLQVATFTDADTGDTHTASINWGDGTVTPGTVNEATGTVTGSHRYQAPGAYTVRVTVSDNRGGSDEGTFQVVVRPHPRLRQ